MTVPTPFAVHVVIPAHNEAALIGRCLTSVRDAAARLLDSTGVAATVVVVADGSTTRPSTSPTSTASTCSSCRPDASVGLATPAFDTCSQAQDRRTDRECGSR